MDAIYGVTRELLAELMTKYGELKAQYGEKQGEAAFNGFLQQKGLDANTWAHAHNAWFERFRADPTGRAEAEFHMLLAEGSQRAHFGDVRDMSQDTQEGITLDQYAQITVAVSRQGADANAIVRQFGLQDVAHWQRANAAWAAKMGQDTTHKLTMQYGQLYQKYAGPQFKEEMVSQTAAILADNNRPRDVVREPEVELTPNLCLEKMRSPSRNERWKYAGLYAHMADLGNVPDKAAAIQNVTPVLMEMIEQHDEHTTSDAEKGIRKLWDLGVRNADIPGAASRCKNRAVDKLQTLQAAFAPIQHQAVPERITLQSRIQDYQSLIETMTEYLGPDHNWNAQMAPAIASHAPQGFGAPAFGGAPMMPLPKKSGGFPMWILAPVVLLVLGGGFMATKGRAMLAARSAAADAANSAPSSSDSASTASVSAAQLPAVQAAAKPAAPAAKPATAPVSAASSKSVKKH